MLVTTGEALAPINIPIVAPNVANMVTAMAVRQIAVFANLKYRKVIRLTRIPHVRSTGAKRRSALLTASMLAMMSLMLVILELNSFFFEARNLR